jgi:multidrug efflux system outer membrane protein
LSLLTDEAPATIERGAVFDILAEPDIPAGLPSSLLRRRPDVAEAEYQLAAADSSLVVARKNFLPQVRLSTALGRSFSTAQVDPITIWSLGGSILAPLFEGGRLTAEAEKAGAQRDEAAFAYRGTVLTAFREVEDALASAKRYDEQLTLVKAQRDTLIETLRIATNRYREGYTTYLDQLDAQRGLLSAQLSVVQIRASALSSRVQLYQAMGGGWSVDSIDKENAE